jgi:inhibitor of KinA sporulation pathway (predicted exonuclease)
MRTPAFYLVIDLEATCDDSGAIPRNQTEIIEIGAVLVDGNSLERREEFQTFVRPIVHKKLTPFCTQLTTIKQSDVDGAPAFAEAVGKLAAFVAGKDTLFCSWGDYDKNQFARDAQRHNVRLPFGRDHWNLKEAFRQRAGDMKKLGNGQALERVGLRHQGIAHRGIDDARNIARLLPYILGRLPIPAAKGDRA